MSERACPACDVTWNERPDEPAGCWLCGEPSTTLPQMIGMRYGGAMHQRAHEFDPAEAQIN